MADVIWIIILAIFCALSGYCFGLRRGYKTYQTPWEDQNEAYNDGYAEGRLDPANFLINEWYWDGYENGRDHERKLLERKQRQTEFVDALEEALGPEDDDGVLDCGEY